jgi:transcription initiation factor TFIIIB Brf1 subunit/transcription initiation factor TFIIB
MACPVCGSSQTTEIVERSKPYAARVVCAECGVLLVRVKDEDGKLIRKIREEE